jgi:hypothetical protein
MVGLPEAAVGALADRVAALADLRLPARLAGRDAAAAPPPAAARREYAAALLRHDAGVFLERHGDLLLERELALFAALRADDYEVDFYLRALEAERAAAPAAAPAGGAAAPERPSAAAPGLPAAVKNRRLAELRRLDAAGEYFGEAAARLREPYLHQLYVGRYERASEAAGGAGAGGGAAALADALARREAERGAAARREAGRAAHGSEEEEEEEEEGEGGEDGGAAAARRTALGDELRRRFLAGADAAADYARVDADAALDEDLAAEAERDLAERYFDAG